MEVPDTALDEPLLQHRKQDIRAQQQTLDWGCALNLAKVITGAGMMAIPRAFLQIGWLPGTIMLLGVALLTFFTLAVLVQASAATQASTYGELVCRTCGVGMMRLLQLAVLLFCFGFSVVYLVVIRDILLGTPPECNGLLCEAFGPAANIDARLLIIAVAVLLCAPLMMLRSMEKLTSLNAAGVAATVVLAAVAMLLAAMAAVNGQAHPISMLPQWDMLGHTRAEQLEALTDVIPVILACYVAHQSVHPLMPLLKPYSQQRMLKVIAVALAISCGTFLMLSVGAAVAFGPSTDINVLNNFSTEGLEPLLGWHAALICSWVVRGGYLICILATLLLYMHPLRSCLAQMLWPTPLRAAGTAVATAPATADALGQVPGTVTAPEQLQHQHNVHDPLLLPHQQQPGVSHVCMQSGEQQLVGASETNTFTEPRQIWQDLEQAVYYPLTYGLLAAMVLTAVTVTNIYQVVSAVGDIASTTQAFMVPGVIAIVLVVWQRAQLKAAAATAAVLFSSDLEGVFGGTGFKLPSARIDTGSVMYAATGAVVLLLGVALFCNGLFERLDAFL